MGVPREIKESENRVALTPAGTHMLRQHGHRVLVEAGAGVGSGFSDEEYERAGAELRPAAQDVFGEAEMVVKVKEPQPTEVAMLRADQILFTYLHLAADAELTNALLERGIVGIAYETVQMPDRSLPLLTPMSEVAGRMSVQIGAHFLEKPQGGSGVLLGGVPGVVPGHVVVIGGGVVGTHAAKMAVGLGARVTVVDINADRLRQLEDLFGARVTTLMSNAHNIAEAVAAADLLIGAVLIPGARAPHLVTADMVQTMRRGSVVVDVAIDQGGVVETSDRVTTHSNPTFERYGVVHYSVANMPGAVPRTSTFALTNVTLPYVLAVADRGWREAVAADENLARGVNLLSGRVVYEAVAQAHQLAYAPLREAI